MTRAGLINLVGQNLRRGRRAFLLSVFGISVGIASLSFFLALSAGVKTRVLDRVFPVGQIEVVPASSNLGGALSVLQLGGGPKPLDDDAVAVLRAQPGVKSAFRRMRMAFPARASGGRELVGRDVHGELIAEGLDEAALAGESLAPQPFADPAGSQKSCQSDTECPRGEYCPLDAARCERPVPAVVSPFMLEIYNGAIAPSHGLPHIGSFLASRFRGFTFETTLGESFVGSRRAVNAPPRTRKLMLVGISPRAAQLALTLPLSVIQKWNADFVGAAAGREYSSLLLVLDENADVTRLSSVVRELGYSVADSGAEKAGLAMLLLTLLFALVSISVVAVAAVNIAHSFFRQVAERRREIGVLRAVGASPGDVQRLILAEAALIGALGGAVGLAVARALAFAIDLASQKFVPDFPFKPDGYFAFEWWIVLGAILCAAMACVLGAWGPARAAARLEPSEALASP